MIEVELLHNRSIVGVTMYLPKVRICLLYHTHAIVISEPFLMESEMFHKINVLYVLPVSSVQQMLEATIIKSSLVDETLLVDGMKVLYALEKLQN